MMTQLVLLTVFLSVSTVAAKMDRCEVCVVFDPPAFLPANGGINSPSVAVSIQGLIHYDSDPDMYLKLAMNNTDLSYMALILAAGSGHNFNAWRWSQYHFGCSYMGSSMDNFTWIDHSDYAYDCESGWWNLTDNKVLKPTLSSFNEQFNPPYNGQWSFYFYDFQQNPSYLFSQCIGIESEHCKLNAKDEAIVAVNEESTLINTNKCYANDLHHRGSYRVKCLSDSLAKLQIFLDDNCTESKMDSEEELPMWNYECSTWEPQTIAEDDYFDYCETCITYDNPLLFSHDQVLLTDHLFVDGLIHTENDPDLYIKLTMQKQILEMVAVYLFGPGKDGSSNVYAQVTEAYGTCPGVWNEASNLTFSDYGWFTSTCREGFIDDEDAVIRPVQRFNDTFYTPFDGGYFLYIDNIDQDYDGELQGWCIGIRSQQCKIHANNEAFVDLSKGGNFELIETDTCYQNHSDRTSYQVQCLSDNEARLRRYSNEHCWITRMISEQELDPSRYKCDPSNNTVQIDYYEVSESWVQCSEDWVWNGQQRSEDGYLFSERVRLDECISDGTDSFRVVCDATLHWSLVNYSFVDNPDCSNVASYVRFMEPDECLTPSLRRSFIDCDFREDVQYLLFSEFGNETDLTECAYDYPSMIQWLNDTEDINAAAACEIMDWDSRVGRMNGSELTVALYLIHKGDVSVSFWHSGLMNWYDFEGNVTHRTVFRDWEMWQFELTQNILTFDADNQTEKMPDIRLSVDIGTQIGLIRKDFRRIHLFITEWTVVKLHGRELFFREVQIGPGELDIQPDRFEPVWMSLWNVTYDKVLRLYWKHGNFIWFSVYQSTMTVLLAGVDCPADGSGGGMTAALSFVESIIEVNHWLSLCSGVRIIRCEMWLIEHNFITQMHQLNTPVFQDFIIVDSMFFWWKKYNDIPLYFFRIEDAAYVNIHMHNVFIQDVIPMNVTVHFRIDISRDTHVGMIEMIDVRSDVPFIVSINDSSTLERIHVENLEMMNSSHPFLRMEGSSENGLIQMDVMDIWVFNMTAPLIEWDSHSGLNLTIDGLTMQGSLGLFEQKYNEDDLIPMMFQLSEITVFDAIFNVNQSWISLNKSLSKITMDDCTFFGNSLVDGAVISAYDVSVDEISLNGLLFRKNSFLGFSSLIDCKESTQSENGQLFMLECEFISNRIEEKALIDLQLESEFQVMITGSLFENNRAHGRAMIATSIGFMTDFIVDDTSFADQMGRVFLFGTVGKISALSLFLVNSDLNGNSVMDLNGERDGSCLKSEVRFTDVFILNTTFNDNEAESGSVMSVSGMDHLSIENSSFINNSANERGVLSMVSAKSLDFILMSSVFRGNSANKGAVLSIDVLEDSMFTVTNCQFIENEAKSEGGVFYLDNLKQTDGILIQDCSFVGNHAEENGAAVMVSDASDGNDDSDRFWVTFEGCSFAQNGVTAPNGGVLSVMTVPVLFMNHCSFSDNVQSTDIHFAGKIMKSSNSSFISILFYRDTFEKSEMELLNSEVYDSLDLSEVTLNMGGCTMIDGSVILSKMSPSLTINHSLFESNTEVILDYSDAKMGDSNPFVIRCQSSDNRGLRMTIINGEYGTLDFTPNHATLSEQSHRSLPVVLSVQVSKHAVYPSEKFDIDISSKDLFNQSQPLLRYQRDSVFSFKVIAYCEGDPKSNIRYESQMLHLDNETGNARLTGESIRWMCEDDSIVFEAVSADDSRTWPIASKLSHSDSFSVQKCPAKKNLFAEFNEEDPSLFRCRESSVISTQSFDPTASSKSVLFWRVLIAVVIAMMTILFYSFLSDRKESVPKFLCFENFGHSPGKQHLVIKYLMQVLDFITDLILCYTLWNVYLAVRVRDEQQVSSEAWLALAILSTVFTVLPFALNLRYTIHLSKQLQRFCEHNCVAAHFARDRKYLIIFCVLWSAGFIPTLQLFHSRLFHWSVFDMGLTEHELQQMHHLKFFLTTLTENVPQMGVQIMVAILEIHTGRQNAISGIILLSMVSSGISILSAITVHFWKMDERDKHPLPFRLRIDVELDHNVDDLKRDAFQKRVCYVSESIAFNFGLETDSSVQIGSLRTSARIMDVFGYFILSKDDWTNRIRLGLFTGDLSEKLPNLGLTLAGYCVRNKQPKSQVISAAASLRVFGESVVHSVDEGNEDPSSERTELIQPPSIALDTGILSDPNDTDISDSVGSSQNILRQAHSVSLATET